MGSNIKKPSKTKPISEVLFGSSKVKNPIDYKTEASEEFLANFEEFVKSKGFIDLSYTTIEDEFKYKYDVDYESIILIRALIPSEIIKLEPHPHKHELTEEDFKDISIALLNVWIIQEKMVLEHL